MLHPVSPRQQTLRSTVLIRDDDGAVTRRKRVSLTDVYRRIDEDLAEL
jgi:hypothetical protein